MIATLIGYARCSTDKQDRAPKLSMPRQAHLVKLHTAGKHSTADLAELFEVSRATVYRVLDRANAATAP